jgi:hypothetical protein
MKAALAVPGTADAPDLPRLSVDWIGSATASECSRLRCVGSLGRAPVVVGLGNEAPLVWRQLGLRASLTGGESAFACARDVTMPVWGSGNISVSTYWGWIASRAPFSDACSFFNLHSFSFGLTERIEYMPK